MTEENKYKFSKESLNLAMDFCQWLIDSKKVNSSWDVILDVEKLAHLIENKEIV